MTNKKGIQLCEEALERLLSGHPQIKEHMDISPTRITAGIVSVEAGFDRGYLKRSRKQHMPIIARIESLKTENRDPTSAYIEKSRKAKILADQAKQESSDAKEMLHAVLTQNLQLVDRVRELEELLAKKESK